MITPHHKKNKNIDLCRVYAKMIWITGLREALMAAVNLRHIEIFHAVMTAEA